jgi:hypothetical protein
MKKKLTLSESELVKVINRIVESYKDDTYDSEDYIEIFFNHFRPWVKKKHGDEIGSYPFSYLVKKYMDEFISDFGMNPTEIAYSYRGTIGNAERIGREFVKIGRQKLPSLRSQEKFTEKFAKPLQFFVNQFNLPDFMEMVFIEETPYRLQVIFKIDWVSLIKSQGSEKIRQSEIRQQLEEKIKDYLGVELGNPTHGNLDFSFKKEYVGVDDWVKKTLNKEIKKKIRELPNARVLHSVRFETNSYSMGGELKLSFKSWNYRSDFVKSVKELLQSMGYNTDILQVTT